MILLTEHWLKRLNEVKSIETKVEYPAGLADGVSNDQRWFVEGDGSRVSKILDFFRTSEADASIVFFNEIGMTTFSAAPTPGLLQEADRIRGVPPLIYGLQ